ncbi:hypothetical protein SLOPH_2574, partial [Spraguea lophii 42_110]
NNNTINTNNNTININTNTKHYSNILAIQILSSVGKYNCYTLTKIEVYGRTLLEDYRLNVKDKDLHNIFYTDTSNIDKYIGYNDMNIKDKIKEIEYKTRKMLMSVIVGIIVIIVITFMKFR